jgi:aryl-alcohol dehydrogenase-like predicted oxidoreductase
METVLGTWQMCPSDGFWQDQNTSDSEKTLRYALRCNIRVFDCAQSYGKGRAEQMLGKIASSDNVLFDTKIMPTTKDIREVIKRSLERLKCSFINRIYIHWPSSRLDWKANLKALLSLKEEGLVRKVGVCNLTFYQLRSLYSEIPIDCFQRPVSLLWSREYDSVREFCSAHAIELAAYSTMGMGLLSGRYHSASDLPKDDPRSSLFCFQGACGDVFRDLLSVCTSEDALLWVKAKDPDILIIGARNPAQLEQNLQILEKNIDPDRFDMLSSFADRLSSASEPVCDNIFSYRW